MRARQAERLVRAERADLQRLDRLAQVVDRAGQRGEVEDRVDLAVDVDVLGDVVLDELEALVAGEVADVARVAGEQVVERDDRVPVGQQAVGEMRADESGAAGDQDARHSDALHHRSVDSRARRSRHGFTGRRPTE